MRSFLRTLLAAAAICVASLGLPAGAGAAEKAIWGPVTLPGGGSAFNTYRTLGVDTWQYTLDFSTIAATRPKDPASPRDPAYRWPAELDRAMAEARRTKIRVALLVTNSPGWANGGRSRLHAPTPRAYSSFVAAASRRYPRVRRWMIWGEPNRADRFLPNGPKAGPRTYSRILDAAYGSLKRVSRRNIVIGGMTWTGGTVKPAPWMKAMRLPNGRRPRLNWFGHNPFPFRFPNLKEVAIGGGFRDISDMDTFSRELRRAFGPGKKLWLSEFNVQSDNASSTFELFVSRKEQAQWLRAAYRIANRLPSVAGLGWLALEDQTAATGNARWGLLTSTGTPKPAFRAYRKARGARSRPRPR